MNKKGNKSYQDTDKRICDFVLKQMETHPLNEISVKEVCSDLEINRSTFYAHFQDIYGVAESLADTYNQELIERCRKAAAQSGNEPRVYLLTMLEHIRDHQVFFRNMFSEDMSIMVEKDLLALRRMIADPLMRSLYVPENRIPFYFAYTQGGFLAVCEMWLNGGCKEDPEEIMRIIHDMNADFEQYWHFPKI